jgi:hypothetical protein
MSVFQNTKAVNSIEEFENQLVNQLTAHYKGWFKSYNSTPIPQIKINKGSKFYKIIVGTSVWGFIARIPFVHKGVQLKKGDLMKPAGWSAAAKHSRGNVIEGTAMYGPYGPLYLK